MVDVRINREAIISFVSALFSLGCFVPGFIAAMDRRVLDPQSGMVQNIACVSIVAGGIAVLFGILALGRIGRSGGRQAGYGFAVIGTAIPPILIFVLAWFNIGRWRAFIPYRMVCGTNLSGIGKAMMIYSQDYDDKFPVAGGMDGAWATRIANWKAADPFEAYDIQQDGSGGRGSISSSFYLLVKYCEVTPKSFVCGGDYGTTVFESSKYGVSDKHVTDLWDFGPNPQRHCSYSYQVPFGEYRLTTYSEPGSVIAADRNPWIDAPFEKASDFRAFDPKGDSRAIRAGNAVAHKLDGQNVLFLDNHVGFEDRSFCGIDDDNIYTYWNGEDIRRGRPPKLGSQPADRADSLLVNDPAIPQ